MSVCILLTQNARQSNYDFTLNVWNEKEMLTGFSTVFSKTEIYRYNPKYFMIPYLREQEKKLFVKFHSNEPLSEYFRCYQGELNMTTHREYFTNILNDHMALKGAQIQRYELLRDHMSQGEIEYVKIKKYLNDFNTSKSRHHTSDRIVMQGITGVNEAVRLKSTYVPAGYFCAHSCNYLIPLKKQKKCSLWSVLALVNSKLFNWVYKKTSTNSNVNSYQIHNLTIPNSPDGLKRLEHLAKLRQYESRESTKLATPTLETRIDQLVYELYGLSNREIALVEGRELSITEQERLKSSLQTATVTSATTPIAPPLFFTGQPPQGVFSQRLKRVQALGKQASPAAIQELVAALADDSDSIRWAAGLSLKGMDKAQVAGVLHAFIEQTENATAKAEAEKLLQSLS